MTPNFSPIKGIIWDLDGTLYRYDDVFRQACNIAAARTAIDLGLKLSYENALALATESEAMYGSSFKLFEPHGILYADFHQPYHKAVDTTILAVNGQMKDALKRIALPMVILTNASRHWALKTIAHLHMDEVFDDMKIVALEDVGHEAKAHSTRGFIHALSILDLKAHEVLMVEDLPRNLVKAKDMGMTTALVHHGQMPEDCGHIDYLFPDTLELVNALAAKL